MRPSPLADKCILRDLHKCLAEQISRPHFPSTDF